MFSPCSLALHYSTALFYLLLLLLLSSALRNCDSSFFEAGFASSSRHCPPLEAFYHPCSFICMSHWSPYLASPLFQGRMETTFPPTISLLILKIRAGCKVCGVPGRLDCRYTHKHIYTYASWASIFFHSLPKEPTIWKGIKGKNITDFVISALFLYFSFLSWRLHLYYQHGYRWIIHVCETKDLLEQGIEATEAKGKHKVDRV